jgi:hypothetical protein
MILDIQRRTPVKGLSVAALALLIATPALAGGLDDGKRGVETKGLPAPALQSTDDHSWTGLWLGAYGGYSMSNSEVTTKSFKTKEATPSTDPKTFVPDLKSRETIDGIGGEGLFGQLQIGFDKQIGDRVVLGAFGGAALSGNESEVSYQGGLNKATPDKTVSLKSEEQETYFAGLRAGYLLNAHNLVYVAGGYWWGGFDLSWTDGYGEAFNEHKAGSADLSTEGFFAELGFESRIAENVYARLAGRYYFGDEERIASNKPGVALAGSDCWEDVSVDPNKLEVMVGLSFKLDGFKY